MRTLALAAIAAVVLVCPRAALAQKVVQSSITDTTCAGTGTIASQETGCVFVYVDLGAKTALSVIADISGTFAGALVFEGSANGNFVRLRAYPLPSGGETSYATRPGLWQIDPAGTQRVRVRAMALDSGSPSIILAPTVLPVRGTPTTRGAGDPTSTSDTAAVVIVRDPAPVLIRSPPLNPFLPRCNAVRTTQCQP